MNIEYPRPESNQRTRFRKPLLYPLSYGGFGRPLAYPATKAHHVRPTERAREARRVALLRHPGRSPHAGARAVPPAVPPPTVD